MDVSVDLARQKGRPQEPQLFEDTSQGPHPGMYGGGAQVSIDQVDGFSGTNLLKDPMVANMAMQYGQSLAGQGKQMLEKNVDKYISVSKLKYYFAVDTSYVVKKLSLIAFPFIHKEWSVGYHRDTPMTPRFDVNAPDLYIPVMAYVTYILISGISLGLKDKFSPEELGMQASSALVWLTIEVAIILFTLYLVNARTDLTTWDVIAFSGYKYVGMIAVLSAGLFFQSMGYWIALAYTSATVAFFLFKSLSMKILPHSTTEGFGQDRSPRMYLTFLIALIQPLFMYWLTRHLVGQMLYIKSNVDT